MSDRFGMKESAANKIKIGLEVHCQLTNLRTKLFCSCPSDYRGKEPNATICPVCMGIPGSLPVLNAKALDYAAMVALALNTRLADQMVFFRKNYFYPDMPKNFQITQYDRAGGLPLATDGYVVVGESRIRIRRLQLEEDPAKLSYEGTIDASKATFVDYNRAGIALIEIVTEPDIESPREARMFLQKLRSILEHLEISDGELEGSMRCDANISYAGGTRVEIKNISSFKEVERALKFEMTRQRGLFGRGLKVERETRHWDELRRITVSLRVKEEEQDYRYFPEPDLAPVKFSDEWIGEIKKRLPELPDVRKQRFVRDWDVPEQNADVLTGDKSLADFFEECVSLHPRPKEISNWLVGDLLAYLHGRDLELKNTKITPQHIVSMLKMVEGRTISGKIAKAVLEEMICNGKMPHEIVEERGLKAILDVGQLDRLTEKIFLDNPNAVREALSNEKVANYLVGQLMKATQGKAEPSLANRVVRERLSKLAR